MKTSRPARLFRRLGLSVPVLALLLAAAARADTLAPVFTGTTPAGSVTLFNYSLVFVTSVNAGAPVERLQAGDFITFYDIPGMTSGSSGSGWGISGQATGTTAPGTSPLDSPALVNVTFTYNGPTITTNMIFTGFSIAVVGSPGSAPGQFTSITTRNSGPGAGSAVGHLGHTTIPAVADSAPVPEPATVVLLGTGLAGVAAASRRASRRRRRSSRG